MFKTLNKIFPHTSTWDNHIFYYSQVFYIIIQKHNFLQK